MNYKEWFETVKSEYTCEFSRDGIRDVYSLPNGIKIHDEVFMPRSIFKPQTQQTFVDIIFPVSDKEWIEKQGAVWDDQRYTEEGYGSPLFVGENCMERAFKFGMNLPKGKGDTSGLHNFI